MLSSFNAFHQTEENFFSTISFTRQDFGNLVAFATGVQASGLNPAMIKKNTEFLSENIPACKSFYQQNNLPWALILPEYLHNEKLAQLLQHHSLQLIDVGVAMGMSLESIDFPLLNASLTIRAMQNELPLWSIPLIHGFESTPEITGVYTLRHQMATNLYHLSGFIDDTIVCSLTISITGENARIDDVATMPDFQKQGYATQLIYAALKHLQMLQIKTCFLEASTSGLSIYKRIGFNELFMNQYYELNH